MAEETEYQLTISRDNWRVLGILLMLLIGAFGLVFISFSLGRHFLKQEIQQSGYSVIEVSTLTNSYYIVEKKSN